MNFNKKISELKDNEIKLLINLWNDNKRICKNCGFPYDKDKINDFLCEKCYFKANRRIIVSNIKKRLSKKGHIFHPEPRWKKKSNKSGFVYIANIGVGYKIGATTRTIQERFTDKRISPYDVSIDDVVLSIKTKKLFELEYALHYIFNNKRLGSDLIGRKKTSKVEVFDLNKKDLSFLIGLKTFNRTKIRVQIV